MRLSTVEAAEKLGVGRIHVHTLIKQGFLKDYKRHSPNHKRHRPVLDSAEVNRLKTATNGHLNNKMRITHKVVKELRALMRANSNTTHVVAPKVPKAVELEEQIESRVRHTSPVDKLTRIESKLVDLEKKVDRLIQIWS